MHESVVERLSRLIDGDLDQEEIKELTETMESDPSLRRELEGLRRVRASLQSLAARDRPPAALDVLVDPLLMGKPGKTSNRPWVRLLATAAVVVLGITVVLEVQRRQPESTFHNWQERALEGVGAEPTERFTLAPLPTSPAPDKQVVGATERLLAAPEPEIESQLDPPPAMEVLGPLDTEEMRSRKGAAQRELGVLPPNVTEKEKGRAPSDEALPSPDTNSAPTAPGEIETLSDQGGAARSGTPAEKTAARSPRPAAATPSVGAQLFVFMEAETAWRRFETQAPSEAGRYALRIRVQGGRVLEVWPVATPPATTRQVRASQLILGLEVENVPDGEYAAEVVVEGRASSDR